MAQMTKIDWLGFRTKAEIPETVAALQGAFGDMGEYFNVKRRSRGWMGFDAAADLCIADMHVGLMAYGGQAQKGWISVNLSGTGCEWVKDWDAAQEELCSLPAFEARRVDIALDTFKREVTHETVVAAHRAGAFTTSGRPPKMSQILPEDPHDGRTVYIGARDQGKFLRGYEKGYELVKDLTARGLRVELLDGVPIGDIYRLELELKAKNADLPEDVIDRRDQYFAGGYPYLQSVLAVEPEIFRQAREAKPKRDLEAALANVRHQYGTTLFTALMAYHGDISAVWELIVGDKHNQALLEKGVLLVEHDG